MKQEYVDIVDENNRVLYKTTKEEAHKKGLLHRTVISEIIDSKGRWLLYIPSNHKQDAGQYVSPIGGHVRSGESEIEALKREAFEEAGLKNFKFKFIGKKIFDRFVIGRHENHFFIVYEIYTDEKPILSDETSEYKYFTRKEIKVKMRTNPKMIGGAFHFVYINFYKDFNSLRLLSPRKWKSRIK